MQAPCSLSVVQRDSLETSFTLFRGVTAFLESLENQLQSDERLTAESLRDLAELCERKLLVAFPDLMASLMEWERRGGEQ
jgi:hypothetical protein